MFHNYWLHKSGSLLVVIGLVLSLSASVFAQSEDGEAEPASAEHTVVDSSFWEESNSEEAAVAKPEQDVVAPADDKTSETAGNQNRVYLPAVMTLENGGGVHAAATDSIASPTTTILNEGFEGIWPPAATPGAPSWRVKDYNGTLGGSFVWDDVNFQHHTGTWSAQPSDSLSYPNNLFSIMEYGPFPLPGADLATFSFWYSLNSESKNDLFTWSYSCDNGVSWVKTTQSGSSGGWKQVSILLNPCMGKNQVWIRFTFTSDTSTPCTLICPPGVYVDDVLVQYEIIQ